MATRYKGEDGGWPGSPMADGADLEEWAVDMLLQWHLDDPVSTKEIERNDAVFAIQENRNPFIDHPEYAQMIYDPQSGIENSSQQLLVTCYPNPARESVTISVSAETGQVTQGRVVDTTGRTVAYVQFCSGQSGETSAQWNCGSESPGVYFPVIETQGSRRCVSFLVLN